MKRQRPSTLPYLLGLVLASLIMAFGFPTPGRTGGPAPNLVTRGEFQAFVVSVASATLNSLGIPHHNLLLFDSAGNATFPGELDITATDAFRAALDLPTHAESAASITALGLGTMASQSAANVAITGGVATLTGLAISGAGTAYTPSVQATTGAITTYVAAGHYWDLGEIVFIRVKVTITTKGSAAGPMLIQIPHTHSSSFRSVIAFSETSATGKSGIAQISPDSATMSLRLYDSTTPFGGDAYVWEGSGWYAK